VGKTPIESFGLRFDGGSPRHLRLEGGILAVTWKTQPHGRPGWRFRHAQGMSGLDMHNNCLDLGKRRIPTVLDNCLFAALIFVPAHWRAEVICILPKAVDESDL